MGGTPRWSSSWRTVSHGKDPMLEQFMEDSVPWEGPRAGAGAECEKERAAETACDEWTAAPFPVPLRHSGGGGREIGSEAEPRKKGGVGEGVLRFGFISHHPI